MSTSSFLSPGTLLILRLMRRSQSIRSIKSIAESFDCDPMEINEFTGNDTIGFHAMKCGITRLELEAPENEYLTFILFV